MGLWVLLLLNFYQILHGLFNSKGIFLLKDFPFKITKTTSNAIHLNSKLYIDII